MRITKAILVLAGVLCLLFYPAASKADTITIPTRDPDTILQFTSDHSTDGLGAPPYGEVDLWQEGGDVIVKVWLYGVAQGQPLDSKFIRTGSGDSYDLKFNGFDKGIVAADITVETGLTLDGPGAYDGDGTGNFDYGIFFTGQKTGGGAGLTTPIEFMVTGAVITDLTTDKNALGYTFVADILSGKTGKTGPADATVPVTVPEPGILILLGLSMTAVGVAARFVRKI